MPIERIRKRDGRIVKFDEKKIADAIHKAFIAVELEDGKKAKKLTKEVVRVLERRFKEKIPSVENVQDVVIEILKKKGYKKVAKEYQAKKERKVEKTQEKTWNRGT